jgi:hypothetical protein
MAGHFGGQVSMKCPGSSLVVHVILDYWTPLPTVCIKMMTGEPGLTIPAESLTAPLHLQSGCWTGVNPAANQFHLLQFQLLSSQPL